MHVQAATAAHPAGVDELKRTGLKRTELKRVEEDRVEQS
jgi:hypothetical protein